MEIAENGFASGSVHDLPPSKRFKHVGAQLGSAPRVLLPAKKRVFPPPPPPEEAAASVCLPVKKRTVVARPPEEPAAAVPFCLPAKKRAIVAPPPEDAAPVCLPAKKHTYALPADAVLPPCQGARECTAAEGCGRFHMRARPRAGASAEGRVFRPHLLTGQQACDAASIHGLRWFSIWHCQRSQASRIQQTRWWRHHSQSKCQGSCSIGKTRCAMLKLG